MNLSKGSKLITYGIIAINVLVFAIMVASGISFMSPGRIDIIKWGANYGPLTLSGDWWRLISCVFVHIGFIHLAFNMYALYMVGVYLEPMLGKTRYIIAYISTGVFASLASLWWHNTPVPSAGASGAIFGMYGVFLALLSTSLIPKQVRNRLLQSIGVFVVYNLVYGMKSGVDNSAHIGGLLSGLAIGYLYFPGLRNRDKKAVSMVVLIAALAAASAIIYLQTNVASAETRRKTMEDIASYKYDDATKYDDQLRKFSEAEDKAVAPFRMNNPDVQHFAEILQNVSLPQWDTAEQAVKQMLTYNVSEKAKKRATLLDTYVELRKKDVNLRIKAIKENDESLQSEVEELQGKIKAIMDELKKL